MKQDPLVEFFFVGDSLLNRPEAERRKPTYQTIPKPTSLLLPLDTPGHGRTPATVKSLELLGTDLADTGTVILSEAGGVGGWVGERGRLVWVLGLMVGFWGNPWVQVRFPGFLGVLGGFLTLGLGRAWDLGEHPNDHPTDQPSQLGDQAIKVNSTVAHLSLRSTLGRRSRLEVDLEWSNALGFSFRFFIFKK